MKSLKGREIRSRAIGVWRRVVVGILGVSGCQRECINVMYWGVSVLMYWCNGVSECQSVSVLVC